jgi:hypothetical protein
MPKKEQRAQGLDELRAWYLAGLRPKLARAAQTGAVESAAVLALDRQMRDLLDVADGERRAAA